MTDEVLHSIAFFFQSFEVTITVKDLNPKAINMAGKTSGGNENLCAIIFLKRKYFYGYTSSLLDTFLSLVASTKCQQNAQFLKLLTCQNDL